MKRRPAVARTSAGTSFEGTAEKAGAQHREARDEEEEPESVARRAGLAGKRDERCRRPDAAQETHTGRGHAVTGEESEERRRELQRDGEGEDAEGDLSSLGRFDPSELEP